jgi:hypothetical protein
MASSQRNEDSTGAVNARSLVLGGIKPQYYTAAGYAGLLYRLFVGI